jgi:predicted ATP-grasp superfamily ATP-dependent carboligase
LTTPVVVVAATSARMLAESARRGGMRPIALDLFGDEDTRRAARCISIADPRGTGIDARRVRDVLARLERHPTVLGWVAGSGFEDRLEVLQEGADVLRLIGNDANTIAAVKQPAAFFALLDSCGIGHPETLAAEPADRSGWLMKRVGGTGGWHVRRLGDAQASARSGAPRPDGVTRNYYQREIEGDAMSVLFLANGVDVCIVGFNRLLVTVMGARPFVFQGAVAPVQPHPAVAGGVRLALAQLVRHLGLVGLNSMDFLVAGEKISVIEINPRPSATMQLHDQRFPLGLMHAHVRACMSGTLPSEASSRANSVRGLGIVYARRDLHATSRSRRCLHELGWCHDIGREGTRTGGGEPLCSVSAEAGSEAEVVKQLAQRADHVQRLLEADDVI